MRLSGAQSIRHTKCTFVMYRRMNILGIDKIAVGNTKDIGPQPWNAMTMDIAPPTN